jgi:NADH dehydrogenase
VLPLIGGGTTRFQPVYVGDVAAAVRAILADDAEAGRLFELGGPRVYTFRELMQLILAETGRRRLLLPVPFAVMKPLAALLSLLPVPPLTIDQLAMLRQDNVVGGQHPGLADLGITPVTAEAILPTYLRRFARFGRLAQTRFG